MFFLTPIACLIYYSLLETKLLLLYVSSITAIKKLNTHKSQLTLNKSQKNDQL